LTNSFLFKMDSLELNITKKTEAIADCIFTKIKKQEAESLGIFSGEFGLLLFLFYYSRYSKSKKDTLLTETYAEKLLEQVVEKERLHTFCSGLAGILYLFEFLRENDFIDIDISSVQPSLDNYLITRLRQNIQYKYFDFMHGALGVGLYLLKKGTYPECIKELIDFLYNTAEKDDVNHFFRWESTVRIQEKECSAYNLSMSHGMSAIIVFLSLVVRSGMAEEKIQEMLSGAVNYVFAQENDFTQLGSYFPNFILKYSPKAFSKSRLAWCYGDLGIAIALWQAGKSLDKAEWRGKGLDILLQSTKRRNIVENFVHDAGICHGSAGIAMIYHRMYLETDEDEFKDATSYWINQTMVFSHFEDGLVGYKTHEKEEWKKDYSLLTGIGGIGIVLLSYLKNNRQIWDEMFLLS